MTRDTQFLAVLSPFLAAFDPLLDTTARPGAGDSLPGGRAGGTQVPA